jgi:hypothetical protein
MIKCQSLSVPSVSEALFDLILVVLVQLGLGVVWASLFNGHSWRARRFVYMLLFTNILCPSRIGGWRIINHVTVHVSAKRTRDATRRVIVAIATLFPSIAITTHHSIQMSDLFYPSEGSKSRYNTFILKSIPQHLYAVRHTPGVPVALVVQTPSRSGGAMAVETKIPVAYHKHVQRFLWRFSLLYTLYMDFQRGPRKATPPRSKAFLERMLVLMDTIIKRLLHRCLKLGHDLTKHSRIPSFDAYLATEFVVGFHDPPHVDAWRIQPENLHFELERMDPFKLGEWHYASSDLALSPSCIGEDWAAYDTALGDILNGSKHEYDVNNLTKSRGDYTKAADGLSQWYDIPLRRLAEKERRTTSGVSTIRS